MSIIVKGGSSFEPAPEGAWQAVCVDVRDLGIVKSELWGNKPMVLITWEISEKMEDGRPFVASKRFTNSLHAKSSLHKFLVSWRGREFTADELNTGFDLEKLITAPCQLVVQHTSKDGQTYANVTAILRASKGQALKPSGKYVRWIDRPENKASKPAPDNPDYGESEAEDVPF
jgi:hypothetical protein